MTSKTKNILVWTGVAIAVIAVVAVVKKASKKPVPATIVDTTILPLNPLGKGPNRNNWDGKGGYSYTLSDGSDDYYDKDGNYVSSD